MEKTRLHIFSFDNDLVVLDINESRPYLIEPVDRAVLRLQSPIEKTIAIQKLDGQYPAQIVLNSIEKLAKLRLLLPTNALMQTLPQEPDYPSIDSLELNIAEDCNLRCTYCCVEQGGFGADRGNGRMRDLMDWEVANRAINLLFEESPGNHAVHIRFFGGEPLMNWPVIVKSVNYAQEKSKQTSKEVSFSIVINGTLLSKEIIRFIQEHQIGVQISIDGTPDMHNACRVDKYGKGSYQRATDLLPDLLNAIGPKRVKVRGTITHFEPNVLKAFTHLQSLGFTSPELRPANGHSPDYGMTVSDYRQYNEGVSELARRVLESAPDQAGQYISLFLPYILLLMSQSIRRPPCGAGRNMIGVSIDGTILPCTDMAGKSDESIRWGNVFSGLERDKKKKFLEMVDVDHKIGCRNCWARYLCGGACASAELRNEGGLEHSAGPECIWVRHLIESSLWLYAKMLAEHPGHFYDLFGEDSKLDMSPLIEAFSIG